jgi:hypothetical protein
MDARTSARLYAGSRIVVGAALLIAPALSGRAWIGPAADRGGSVALRGFGIRDIVLGATALHVADHPQIGPRWMAACGVADLVDLAATAAERDRLPASSVLMMGTAAAGAAWGFALANALRR